MFSERSLLIYKLIMSRKRDFQKIYNQIDEISKGGRDLYFDYIKLIDEIIENGMYYTLSDVMTSKYNLKLEEYRNIDEFKRISYKKIREKTNSTESVDFSKLYKYRNVYNIGRKFFDVDTNLFLGEIGEYKDPYKSDWYRDPALEGKQGVNLEYYWGLTAGFIATMATFSDNSVTKRYSHGDLYKYENKIWNCYLSYTYSSSNRITPTFSSNWKGVYHGTFSYNTATGSDVSIYLKWNTSISGVKSFIYSDPNSTNTGTFSFNLV